MKANPHRTLALSNTRIEDIKTVGNLSEDCATLRDIFRLHKPRLQDAAESQLFPWVTWMVCRRGRGGALTTELIEYIRAPREEIAIAGEVKQNTCV